MLEAQRSFSKSIDVSIKGGSTNGSGGSTIGSGGSTIGSGGSTTGSGGSTIGSGGSTIGSGGSTIGSGGSTIGSGGSTIGSGGSTIGVGGSTIGVGGSTIGVGGSTIGVGGSTIGVGGSTIGVGGSTIGVGGSTIGVGGSTIGVGGSTKGIGTTGVALSEKRVLGSCIKKNKIANKITMIINAYFFIKFKAFRSDNWEKPLIGSMGPEMKLNVFTSLWGVGSELSFFDVQLILKINLKFLEKNTINWWTVFFTYTHFFFILFISVIEKKIFFTEEPYFVLQYWIKKHWNLNLI